MLTLITKLVGSLLHCFLGRMLDEYSSCYNAEFIKNKSYLEH